MKKPNILFVTTDQQRADTLGCEGHPCVRTPHLDLLAAEGVRFTQAYTDCPVCIPARTTLVTGLQSHRYGMPEFCPSFRLERDRELFLGARMTAAGYQTCLIGKSHWHTEPHFRGGFETWVRFEGLERERREKVPRGAWPGIGGNELSASLSPFPPELCTTNWTITKAQDFLEERDKDQPFFLWVSMIDPHPPNVIHEPYYSMYDDEEIPLPVLPEWSLGSNAPCSLQMLRFGISHGTMTKNAMRKARGVYYGMITNVDHQLGRLFGALKRTGEWENTLIVFTSDHGELLGDYGTFFKAKMLEGSVRLPMIVRCPESLAPIRRGGVSDSLVQLADLFPTFCEVGGAKTPADIDGVSLLSLFRGEEKIVRDRLHGQIGFDHFWHDGRYKYLYFSEDGRELVFDKTQDPLDERDLSSDSRLLERLREEFRQHLIAEKNPHIVEDGALQNLGKKANPSEAGSPLDWIGVAGRI